MTLHLPKKSNYGHVLLEIENAKLNFDADTGDIGRIKSTQSKLTVDIQGKIFEGPLVETPTTMIVNLDGKVAQCEAVLQNVCRMQQVQSMYEFETTSGDIKPLIFEHDIEVQKNDSTTKERLEKVAKKQKGKVSSGKGKRRRVSVK